MSKTTYIIPVRVESADRARNLFLSVSYLLKNTDGIVMIKEFSEHSNVPEILGSVVNSSRVRYLYEQGVGAFHRTRLLNDMIEAADTEIICNYDADIILPENAYSESEQLILSRSADAVYPYPRSSVGQIQVFFENRSQVMFSSDLQSSVLLNAKWKYCWASAGFCVFVRADDYKRAGGEYEGFVSYGPEDGERILRLEKMGLNVKRLDNSIVYHMEHVRTHESDMTNPHYRKNDLIYNQLKDMDRRQMVDHLKSCVYIARRNWKGLVS